MSRRVSRLADRAAAGRTLFVDEEADGLLPPGLAHPATAGVALALAAALAAFFSITDVVGGTTRLTVVLVAAALVGFALARVLSEEAGVALAVAMFVGGLGAYYFAVPASQRALFSVRTVLLDTVSLLTGLSVLRLTMADVWVLAVAPVPVFLACYLAGRGRHVAAAGVAAGALGFFVLTGDAGTAATLVCAVGVALAAGLSTLSVPGGFDAHWDTLAVVMAIMLVLSGTLTLVPGSSADPWATDRGTPGLESTLDSGDEELEVVGSTRLSPEVRFTVQSTEPANWHTASYDRYTGDGWVRTGDTSPYEGSLDGPPGETRTVEQNVTAETDMRALPSAWQGVSVEGPVAGSAQVDTHGGIHPGTTVLEGDDVTIESEVVAASSDELRDAGEDYPDGIADDFTQLPESTPDRVGEHTSEVVDAADADNPYDKAVAVETYLQESKDYSLSVERPDGDVADGFLFEMDAGYCTYFATTMVAMLRSEGVPAKFVTGYSTGERVADDEWVVRGQDAHAWVMVYFPEHGWVEFDPTPSAERDEVRETRLAEARQSGDETADIEETAPETPEPLDDGDDAADGDDDDGTTPEEPTNGDDGANDSLGGGADGGGDGVDPRDIDGIGPGAEPSGVTGETSGDDGPLPDRETLGYWALAVLGAVAGAHHVGATNRAYRAAWLRLPARKRDPVTDAERAYARLEYLLERRHRARRAGETPRSYLDSLRIRRVDDRAHRIGEIHERAAYGGEVTREEADEAMRLVRRMALEETPVVGRLFERGS